MKITNSKDQTYWSILNAAIALDIQKGHLNWTMSELARKSGIKRTLIYYYFGKEKIDILLEACHLFGKIYAGTSDSQKKFFQNNDFFEGLKYTKEILKECPALPVFYFTNRNQDNELSRLIKYYHQQGINTRCEYLNGDTLLAKAIFAFQMGLVLFDDTSLDDLESLSKYVSRLKKSSLNSSPNNLQD